MGNGRSFRAGSVLGTLACAHVEHEDIYLLISPIIFSYQYFSFNTSNVCLVPGWPVAGEV